MLRLARVIAIAAASGVFVAVPPLPARAAVPTSFCVPSSTYPIHCTFYESKNGAPSEVSDIVTIPLQVSAGEAVLLQNPNGSFTDRNNWSDVIEFIPQATGRTDLSVSARFLSEGCGNLQNPLDITCFPAAYRGLQDHKPEVATGQGNDFTDCTTINLFILGSNAGSASVCSDSPAVEAGDTTPVVPEVPIPILLPVAALGVVGLFGFRKLRRRSA
jgi:hypothetical protein